jgi:hypothetical protein
MHHKPSVNIEDTDFIHSENWLADASFKSTIENYKTRLFTKAGAHNSTALVAWAFRNGVVK